MLPAIGQVGVVADVCHPIVETACPPPDELEGQMAHLQVHDLLLGQQSGGYVHRKMLSFAHPAG